MLRKLESHGEKGWSVALVRRCSICSRPMIAASKSFLSTQCLAE